MSMSKRNYIEFAKLLKQAKGYAKANPTASSLVVLDHFQELVADYLKSDNYLFNRDRFNAACEDEK